MAATVFLAAAAGMTIAAGWDRAIRVAALLAGPLAVAAACIKQRRLVAERIADVRNGADAVAVRTRAAVAATAATLVAAAVVVVPAAATVAATAIGQADRVLLRGKSSKGTPSKAAILKAVPT